MSGLWTPSSGNDPAGRDPTGGGPADPHRPTAEGASADSPSTDEPSTEEVAALRELHGRLVATPVVDVIVNHALGIWQLALVHLGVVTPPDEQGRPAPVDLAAAGLAIDAVAALVDTLGTRLGEGEAVLRDALAQAQMLFVEIADTQPPTT